MIIVRLKPATIAYNVSDVATPRPEIKPDFQVLFTVLLMQRIPNGPRGMDTAIPIIMPSSNNFKLMEDKNSRFYNLSTQWMKKGDERLKIDYF
jgi:hypothetical protein